MNKYKKFSKAHTYRRCMKVKFRTAKQARDEIKKSHIGYKLKKAYKCEVCGWYHTSCNPPDLNRNYS